MEIAEIAFNCFFSDSFMFFGWFLGSLYLYALHVCFSSHWTSPVGQCPYVCFCCFCVVRPVIAFYFCWALSSALRSHDQIPGLIKFSPKMNYWKFCGCTTPLKKNKITFQKKRKEIIPPPKKKLFCDWRYSVSPVCGILIFLITIFFSLYCTLRMNKNKLGWPVGTHRHIKLDTNICHVLWSILAPGENS